MAVIKKPLRKIKSPKGFKVGLDIIAYLMGARARAEGKTLDEAKKELYDYVYAEKVKEKCKRCKSKKGE